MNAIYAILCAVGIQSEVLDRGIIGGNYVKAPSGKVYVAGFWVDGHEIPDSGTHTNITVAELPAFAAQLPTLGKSVAISGITDPQAFMDAFGLVRCDKDGNPVEGNNGL
jgi:hypothetical protein